MRFGIKLTYFGNKSMPCSYCLVLLARTQRGTDSENRIEALLDGMNKASQ